MYIKKDTIENWIKEDVPYIDLTSLVMGIEDREGLIKYKVREDGIICGTEELKKIFEELEVETKLLVKSGSKVSKGDEVFIGKGYGDKLNIGWKVGMNILEYASGISSRTRRMVDIIKEKNPKLDLLTTRKIFPGTKEISIKAIISGGGIPHRLGLSETILVFKNHMNLVGGFEKFVENLNDYAEKVVEKKFIVEAENIEQVKILTKKNIDGIQLDKFSVDNIKRASKLIRDSDRDISILIAGGVNEKNVGDIANLDIDGIITTSVYFGKPFDIGVEISKI